MVSVSGKISSKGQIVLPKIFRDEYGLSPGQSVIIKEEGGKLVIEKPKVSIKDLLEQTSKKYGKHGYTYHSLEYEEAMEKGE